jgi:ketosteroid isomerase-like protein
MGRENVDVVRHAIDAFNRRDLEALSAYADPEVEVHWSRSRGLEAGIYRGEDAAQGFLGTFFEMFDEVTIIPDDFIEVGDHVVVPNRTRLRGRDGIDVQAHSGPVATLRAGRITRWRLYQEQAEALEVVSQEQENAEIVRRATTP